MPTITWKESNSVVKHDAGQVEERFKPRSGDRAATVAAQRTTLAEPLPLSRADCDVVMRRMEPRQQGHSAALKHAAS